MTRGSEEILHGRTGTKTGSENLVRYLLNGHRLVSSLQIGKDEEGQWLTLCLCLWRRPGQNIKNLSHAWSTCLRAEGEAGVNGAPQWESSACPKVSGQSTNVKLTDQLQKIAVADSYKCLDIKTSIASLKFSSGLFEFFVLLAWYQIWLDKFTLTWLDPF